jgi:hypothetical protein
VLPEDLVKEEREGGFGEGGEGEEAAGGLDAEAWLLLKEGISYLKKKATRGPTNFLIFSIF